jgi:transcription elongation factor Elf1
MRRNFYRRNTKKKVARKSFKVACAQCGKELDMEVPPLSKDLLCLDCYNKK